MTDPQGGTRSATMGRLQDKVTIITGASRGIGAAAGELFASEGATVVLASRDEGSLQRFAKQINESGGTALAVATDVSDVRSVADLVKRTVDTFGRLDGAFNNAGAPPVPAPAHLMDVDEFERVVKLNLFGTFYCIKYEAEAMLASGGGAIVNTTSTGGLVGGPNCSDYISSKHGVVGLTKTAALDYAMQGIRVNAIAPGAIRTKMLLDTFGAPEAMKRIMAGIPMGRVAEPIEVARAAGWLLPTRRPTSPASPCRLMAALSFDRRFQPTTGALRAVSTLGDPKCAAPTRSPRRTRWSCSRAPCVWLHRLRPRCLRGAAPGPVLHGLLGDLRDQGYERVGKSSCPVGPTLVVVDEAGIWPLRLPGALASTCAGIGVEFMLIDRFESLDRRHLRAPSRHHHFELSDQSVLRRPVRSLHPRLRRSRKPARLRTGTRLSDQYREGSRVGRLVAERVDYHGRAVAMALLCQVSPREALLIHNTLYPAQYLRPFLVPGTPLDVIPPPASRSATPRWPLFRLPANRRDQRRP